VKILNRLWLELVLIRIVMKAARAVTASLLSVKFWASTESLLRLPSFHHFPFHPSIFKYLEA
jgi:hypothetical protein